MKQDLRSVAVWFSLAGVLTLIRQIIELADPAYYDPVSGLDYLAAWLTSLAGAAVAVALFMWWRRSPIRRGSLVLLIAAAGAATFSIGNLIGDVFDVEAGDLLWSVGGITMFAGLVLAGLLALTVRDSYRWSGLFLIVYAAGWGFPDSGGYWLAGAAMVGMGYWVLRTSTARSSSASDRV